MTELIVSNSQSGQRLDTFIANNWDGGQSRSKAQRAIQAGEVLVNNKVVNRPSTRVNQGQRIDITTLSNIDPNRIQPRDIPLDVAYEDEHLAVINKQTGIAVHPGAGHSEDTLVNGAIKRWPHIKDIGKSDRPGIVHRLDKDTSGLMVIALSTQAYNRLSEMIRKREIIRIYSALVHGIPKRRKGIVDAPIGRSKQNRLKQTIMTDGKPSRTHYLVDYEIRDFAYLKIKLETGRMHQIRVHMEAIGHPVIGDKTYGKNKKFPELDRQFLHASKIEFLHPITSKSISLSSDLPEDLQEALRRLN